MREVVPVQVSPSVFVTLYLYIYSTSLVLGKNIKVKYRFLFGLFLFDHVTVMFLQESCRSPVAWQLCFHVQLMIWAMHCWICFSNLLSHVPLSSTCRLKCVWLHETFQCCFLVSTFAFFERMLSAHRYFSERAV